MNNLRFWIDELNPGIFVADGSRRRDKSKNTPAFNKKARQRRAKAKKAAVSRKKNR